MTSTPLDDATRTTEIMLVRHGETEWNRVDRLQGRTDIPLSDLGLAQAGVAALALAAEPWDAIFSGPLLRATQTAQPIAVRIGLPVDTDLNLTERSWGDAEGTLPEERYRRWPDKQWSGSEPIEQVRERASRALASILEQYPHGRVIVVSHGGLLNAMLSVISGGRVGTGVTKLRNLSFTRIRRNIEMWEIVTLNDESHLVGMSDPATDDVSALAIAHP